MEYSLFKTRLLIMRDMYLEANAGERSSLDFHVSNTATEGDEENTNPAPRKRRARKIKSKESVPAKTGSSVATGSALSQDVQLDVNDPQGVLVVSSLSSKSD